MLAFSFANFEPGLLDNVILFGALVLGALINKALISLVAHAVRRRAAEHKQQPARQPSGHPRMTPFWALVQDISTLSVRRDTTGARLDAQRQVVPNSGLLLARPWS